MPMGIPAAITLGAGAMSATSSLIAGQQQSKAIKAKGEYDAQIYEQQASAIQQQKKISDYQFNRNAARARAAIVARTAGKGFQLSGSPLAILIDNETQMQFDNAIEQYNYDINRNYAMSAASSTRQSAANQASLARATGLSNAFSTILNTGTSAYSMYKSDQLLKPAAKK